MQLHPARALPAPEVRVCPSFPVQRVNPVTDFLFCSGIPDVHPRHISACQVKNSLLEIVVERTFALLEAIRMRGHDMMEGLPLTQAATNQPHVLLNFRF